MMNFEDEEAQQAILDAIAGDNGGQPVEMPAQEIQGAPSDPMDRLLALADMQSVKPVADITVPRPGMTLDESPVTVQQRQESQEPGFDWARGFWAAGGGDLASFDAGREKRQAAKNAQVADFAKRQELKLAMDPQSDFSRARQGEYASTMQSYAQMLADAGNVTLAERFAEKAKMAPTMSALQIDRDNAATEKLMGNSINIMKAKAQADLAKQNMGIRERQAAATERLAGANFALRREEFNARQEDKERMRAEQEAKDAEAEQAKLGKDLAPLNESKALLNQAKDQKKKVNTGIVSNFIQTKILAPLGIKDADFTSLEATMGTLNNAIMKANSGGTITDNEAMRLRQQLADLSQDDPEFDIKLNQMMNTIALKISEVQASHPRATKARAGSSADPRIELAKKALADPNASPAHKEAAKRILEKAGVAP